MRRIGTCLAVLAAAASATVSAVEPIDAYVTPYYDASGPKVSVDPSFDAGLASKDPAVVRSTVESMRTAWPRLRPTTMFVAAIRLYDIGDRDESVYWFYEAQLRARVLHDAVEASAQRMGDPVFELNAAHNAFMQLAGEDINGAGLCDADAFLATLERVRKQAETPPDFAAMYPEFRFDDLPAHLAKNREGLASLIGMFRAGKDGIARERRRNGTEARYCGP